MRRILYALILGLIALPAYAQQWDQVNGSMQVRSGPTAPLVIIDQTASGQKIISLRANGTEVCYATATAFTCTGGFTFPTSCTGTYTGPFTNGVTSTGQCVNGSAVTTTTASAVTSTVPISAGGASVAAANGNLFLPNGQDLGISFRNAAGTSSAATIQANSLNYLHFRNTATGITRVENTLFVDSEIRFGDTPDIVLGRGAANRLDLASGDSFAIITNQPTAPTNATAVDPGTVTRLRSSSTITPASGGVGNCAASFLAAATTADCTIATLPAGMQLQKIYAEVTAGFTCSGTCTGTKVVQCGTAAGGTEVLAAAFDVTATGVAGDADAELGSGMTRAGAIQGGLLGSWTTTTPISCRFTSGTGNWGDGVATFVNAGSIKFTLVTEQLK